MTSVTAPAVTGSQGAGEVVVRSFAAVGVVVVTSQG
jgi:hypothetical protein